MKARILIFSLVVCMLMIPIHIEATNPIDSQSFDPYGYYQSDCKSNIK